MPSPSSTRASTPSASSQTSSEPMLFSGRVLSSILTSLNPKDA